VSLTLCKEGLTLTCDHSINVQKNPEGGEVKTFPNNAAWEVFRDHYLTEHPSEHQDIVQLKSAQIFELRRRLKAKQSS
jgi:hypothetical protein